MSLVASLTPRALFLVRIVFTVALKRAVLSILISEQKPAEIDEIDKAPLGNRALFTFCNRVIHWQGVLGNMVPNKHGGL